MNIVINQSSGFATSIFAVLQRNCAQSNFRLWKPFVEFFFSENPVLAHQVNNRMQTIAIRNLFQNPLFRGQFPATFSAQFKQIIFPSLLHRTKNEANPILHILPLYRKKNKIN